MLKLVASTPSRLPMKDAGLHIEEYAPAFAVEVLNFLNNRSDHQRLLITCKQQLVDWWALSMPSGTPPSRYESVYWFLVHYIEARREHELLGNRFIRQQAMQCACYLISKENLPSFAHGIRP